MKIFFLLVFLFSFTFVASANNYSPEELKQLGDQIRTERLKNEIDVGKAKFHLDLQAMQCPKCGSKRYADSEFPSPDGQIVIQCSSCKKMMSIKEFMEKNNVVLK